VRLFHTYTNEWGVTRDFYIDEMTGEMTVNARQDVEPVIELNKRAQLDRGKKITSEYANPLASIPPTVYLKWFVEEGWWIFDTGHDPDVEKKLNAKLNCSDWRNIRTSELRV
jgi:hypothetical protein